MNSAAIKQQALEVGFSHVGIAKAESGIERDRLQAWLELGYQADMQWMANPQRQDIQALMPGIKSVICLGLNYYTPAQHQPDQAKISRYGWGRDYHRVLTKKLKLLDGWLHQQQPEIATRFYVDTGPVSEKAWAERAGIGWIGKHSNLITRDCGSWLFLAEILVDLDLEADSPHPQYCGTCTRCLTACPTGAIAQPFVVDANRCIAYHTIENRAPELPEAIATNLNNWVAGCDICQDVCPWNQKFSQVTTEPDFFPRPENLHPSLTELAEISAAEYDQRFTGSALRRIKLPQLQRNAQAALAIKAPGNDKD
ncbi:MAG: tRNA epoxyqueuosine(34) reductase QueG [Pseudanabaenaceae cyanobacterium bins.68]|nr:tRNA epoxyqueuosine(34) reductase QueG [Pseudanabaenaceae cyanobacterium bins.68]